jgi:putative nucleotidyltransferase with HDIG domain
MAITNLLSRLNIWLESYVSEFHSEDPVVQENIELKKDHTLRVRDAIMDIGASIGLVGDELALAEICALLHDIGRFEQYRKYRTFLDSKSENHAALGVRIIRRFKILDGLDHSLSDIILRAVELHNTATLPSDKGSWMLYLKLLRDADKIDIWHVLTESYRNASHNHNPAIGLDLPDVDSISDPICTSLDNKRSVLMKDLRTLNDFKLMQMGWIYDLNFVRSFQIVRERRYMEKIRAALPLSSGKVNEIFGKVITHIANRLSADLESS